MKHNTPGRSKVKLRSQSSGWGEERQWPSRARFGWIRRPTCYGIPRKGLQVKLRKVVLASGKTRVVQATRLWQIEYPMEMMDFFK